MHYDQEPLDIQGDSLNEISGVPVKDPARKPRVSYGVRVSAVSSGTAFQAVRLSDDLVDSCGTTYRGLQGLWKALDEVEMMMRADGEV